MAQWSHSRIESFRQCPRKYFYKYVAKVKLPEEPETIEQFVGKRAHDVLERLYAEAQRGHVASEDEFLGWFRMLWGEQWRDAITMPGGDRPAEEHRSEAERWLTDYHRRHAPFDASRTMAVERVVRFPLDAEGRVTMMGFIDRLARATDGTWEIHDYKTNRNLPTQQEKDSDPQLAYYEIGVRRLWPDAARVELVWHFLKFDVAIRSRRTAEQLDAVREAALVTIADAQARPRVESAFPTHETRLCAWCDYETICPARRHVVRVRALPPDRFAGEPGVKLVDHWTGLDDQRRELKVRLESLEAEIDEVKSALAEWAGREGVETVAGREREATVRRAEDVIFPRKTVEAEEAAALEAQLRASRWWPEASALDRAALARLWERRVSLDQDLRALLEEYARVEERTDVRLRKPRA